MTTVMRPFHIYVDVEPTLDRVDVFLATAKYSAEPEPYSELLIFPTVERARILRVARLHTELDYKCIPRCINVGTNEGRYFYSLSLGPMSTAPKLSPLRQPILDSFWKELGDALEGLHKQGWAHGDLSADTIAISDQGHPVLYDLLSVRRTTPSSLTFSVETDPSLRARRDWEALAALRARLD